MPDAKLEAVIWDLDGVIADTGSYHFRAWQQVFSKRGVSFTEEDFRYRFGQRNDEIIRGALGANIAPGELEIIAREKEETLRRLIAGNVKPLPGAIELIRSLRQNGLKVAIASSGPPENIQLMLRELGIEDCFQAIVSGREVAESKPSPQIFLRAARKLGVPPGNSVVMEDAVAGVAGAKRAGMKCVAVTSSHPGDSLKEADLIVATLEAVSIDTLYGLFRRAPKK